MNRLALECSTDLASVALSYEGRIVQKQQRNTRTHAQYLLPMVDEVLAEAGVTLNQLDGIVFGRGPGSFTGLRIACSLAKGLAYPHDLPLYPVSTLATIAWMARNNLKAQDKSVLAVLDARMQEVYWALYPAGQFEAEEGLGTTNQLQMLTADILAGFQENISGFDTVYPCLPEAASMLALVEAQNILPVPMADASPVYVRNKVTS